jgi:hypothetical protein
MDTTTTKRTNDEIVEKLRQSNFVFKSLPPGASWPEPTLEYYNSNCAVDGDPFVNVACKSKTTSAFCIRLHGSDNDERVKLLKATGTLCFRAASCFFFVFKGSVNKRMGIVDDGLLRGAELSLSWLVSGSYQGSPVEYVGGELTYAPEELTRMLTDVPSWYRQ